MASFYPMGRFAPSRRFLRALRTPTIGVIEFVGCHPARLEDLRGAGTGAGRRGRYHPGSAAPESP